MMEQSTSRRPTTRAGPTIARRPYVVNQVKLVISNPMAGTRGRTKRDWMTTTTTWTACSPVARRADHKLPLPPTNGTRPRSTGTTTPSSRARAARTILTLPAVVRMALTRILNKSVEPSLHSANAELARNCSNRRDRTADGRSNNNHHTSIMVRVLTSHNLKQVKYNIHIIRPIHAHLTYLLYK